MINKKAAVICFLLAVPCFAENEFSLRLAPVLQAPAGVGEASLGAGAAAILDWTFLSFAGKFDLGVFFGAGLSRIHARSGDALNLAEVMAGPLLRWQLSNRWSLHAAVGAGFSRGSRGNDKAVSFILPFSAGAQFRIVPFFSLYSDVGFTYRRSDFFKPMSTVDFSFGIKLNITEIIGAKKRIKIENTGQYGVFPVLWSWYEKNPAAEVKLTNNERNAITGVSLSVFTGNYMNRPWTFAEIENLGPGESVTLPVTALFNDSMLDITEDTDVDAVVQVRYRSLGAAREASFPLPLSVFQRSAIGWDDTRRAAAFVSPHDNSARSFARYVAGAFDSQQTFSGAPGNVALAAAVFEALRLYGVSYFVNPAASYAIFSMNGSVPGSAGFPYQTLHYRGGDSPHLSVLYCSILEALDIETAFITVPGHIYAAFEIGDEEWMAHNGNIIELDNRRWLPVEITIPDQGFTRAWLAGAREWLNAGWQAKLYPVHECWKLFPSVTVSAQGIPDMPPREEIVKAAEKELAQTRLFY